ncbi:MAG: glycosyltransferase family 4 protein [Deltaproteobacteria bacterium]|nr:glycosyltransferase family 4 protein [Deltaproteobacteria bacterium]
MSREEKNARICILLDAREFVPGRLTGIGRVLLGLAGALSETSWADRVILAGTSYDAIPPGLKAKEKISFAPLPSSFLWSELALTRLADASVDLFISPYPKLPLFGVKCPAAHFVHDILDLTHPAYRKRAKRQFDSWRLKKALRKATLTWYDSYWSLEETKKYAGYSGKNPKVRHLGIDERFDPLKIDVAENTLKTYDLEPGYILVIGNGLPHKNLGVLLELANEIGRRIVFAGIPEKNRGYWRAKYPQQKATWIGHVSERDLPAIIKGAFCLAQPSTAEGYGYPPLEAMACGVPAVVSNIPVLIETTGGNALIADPWDPRSWREAFAALENKNTYREQVERGLRWVEPLRGHKGWEKHVSDVDGILSKSTECG